jgi:hypothetical protein
VKVLVGWGNPGVPPGWGGGRNGEGPGGEDPGGEGVGEGKGVGHNLSCVVYSVVTIKSNKKELLQTESTVILHITCALKQDPELRKVFTKSLKVSLICYAAPAVY